MLACCSSPIEQVALSFLPACKSAWQAQQTVRIVMQLGVLQGIICGSLVACVVAWFPWLLVSDTLLFPFMSSVAVLAFASMVLTGEAAMARCCYVLQDTHLLQLLLPLYTSRHPCDDLCMPRHPFCYLLYIEQGGNSFYKNIASLSHHWQSFGHKMGMPAKHITQYVHHYVALSPWLMTIMTCRHNGLVTMACGTMA